ncbi:MAG: 4Fe-4S binding protein [Clostridiaceae bacterium]|nr:4Fe-4S binding protein [Clostridiaceae bacterium]
MASKRYAEADRTVCVACGTCQSVCPKRAAAVVKGRWAEIDRSLCVGCGLCANACPANCIKLTERSDLS